MGLWVSNAETRTGSVSPPAIHTCIFSFLLANFLYDFMFLILRISFVINNEQGIKQMIDLVKKVWLINVVWWVVALWIVYMKSLSCMGILACSIGIMASFFFFWNYHGVFLANTNLSILLESYGSVLFADFLFWKCPSWNGISQLITIGINDYKA